MIRWTAPVALALALLAGCGGGSSSKTAAPKWAPPRPLTEAEFAQLVAASGQSRITPLGDGTRGYYESICRGVRPTLRPRIVSYTSDLPAYQALFVQAARQCPAAATVLDRVRGDAAQDVANGELAKQRLLHPNGKDVEQFCGRVQKSSSITKPLVMKAVTEAGLAKGAEADLLSIGLSVLIKACPQLLR